MPRRHLIPQAAPDRPRPRPSRCQSYQWIEMLMPVAPSTPTLSLWVVNLPTRPTTRQPVPPSPTLSASPKSLMKLIVFCSYKSNLIQQIRHLAYDFRDSKWSEITSRELWMEPKLD